MTEKQSSIVFKGYVIKGWEIRRGFRVEVQYLEFGFRLRCVMKKAEFYSSVSLYTAIAWKEKSWKRASGFHLSLSLLFIQVHFDSFVHTAHSYSKVCFKTESVHILNTSLYRATVVAAARRIIYSPTFHPASHTLFFFLPFFLRLGLSWVFMFKNEFFSLTFVWVYCHFAVMCVFFFLSVCVYVAGCMCHSFSV